MAAATDRVGSVEVNGDGALPRSMKLDLASGVKPYQNWLMARNAAGYGVAVSAIPDLICVGAADADCAKAGASNGDADIPILSQTLNGYANSAATAGDTFAETDFGKPAFGVDNQTIGKLSNYSGANRSMVGIFLGFVQSKTILLTGIAGWLLARATHLADNANGGSLVKVIDAGAGTDTVNGYGEALVPRPKLHGTVQAVEFLVEGTTLAASGNTDYTTLTLYKRDGAGGAAVEVASKTTKTTAFTQWTAVSFDLSAVAGAVNLLETDLLTLVKTHGGAGAIVPAGTLRVSMKVG